MDPVIQIVMYIRHLAQYSHQCDAITASNIRKILRILIKYVALKQNRGFGSNNYNYLNSLSIYIKSIKNDVPINILRMVNAALEIIRNDQNVGIQYDMSDDNDTELSCAISQTTHTHTQSNDIGFDECNKYEKLRCESNTIRIRLAELKLDPDANWEQISNLERYLAIITDYTSNIEKKYGGGASKF
jgi:hypothetical protein